MSVNEPAIADDRLSYFQTKLLSWWKTNGRTYPWRETRDPYLVLVAELMLRRTRADQVIPVFRHFVERYPTVAALAAAEAAEVAEALYPLGLAWRVPAFQEMAETLTREHGGEVPSERTALLALPGVGEYVAEAVRVFSFGCRGAVIDTNTVRVAARYIGFPYHAESRRQNSVKAQVRSLLGHEQSRDMNLAILDFGATVCKARQPNCLACPVARCCAFARTECR